ncbi:MAG: hypothetical protein MJ197_03520 [Bacteroidales bacterium]|nr:hypothetical protein [Bacteroidales bacterium]
MSSSTTYSFAKHISTLFDNGEKLDWKQAQKIAKDFSIKTDTEIMQACELAVVLSSRKIAHNGNSIRQQYEELKDLYERQVTIKPLDTKSRVLQQYSTPCPLSYLLGKFVGNNDKICNGKISEPSAGNGMLTIAFNPNECDVNELDEIRVDNLRQQGFNSVTNKDASIVEDPKREYKGIITNPPFAKLEEKDRIVRQGWEINTLDYKMACLALDKMHDNGKAAIIVGGKLWNAYWKPVSATSNKKMLYGQWKTFLGYLYAQYNVVDVIYVEGDNIYRKQGTQYPIVIILIDGRNKYDESNKPRYVFDPIMDTTIQTYDQLFDRIYPYIKPNTNQNKAKALMLKMKMSKSTLSYLPPHLFKNLGLAGSPDVSRISREMLTKEYSALHCMGKELADKNTNYRKAYEWASELNSEHFSSAFTAALMVLQAGFHLPKLKARSSEIRERGVGGQFTIRPYNNFTRITLSTSSYFTSMGGLEAAFEESYRQKWNSTPNCALHELCHHIAFIIDSEYHQLHTYMTDAQKIKARENVSGYAKQQYCEFCAEVISGILYGKKYPAYIIEQLPEPKRGTEDEQEAFRKLTEIGTLENKKNEAGSFIPKEILHNLEGINDFVNPSNIDTYNYSERQKKNPLYSSLKDISEIKHYYKYNSLAHCAIDNWCKVMNNTFDFAEPFDIGKADRVRMLHLQMKNAELIYQL